MKSERNSADVSSEKITKIVTIEASGMGIAALLTQQLLPCSVVFAEKHRASTLDRGSISKSRVFFTHKRTYDVILSKKVSRRPERSRSHYR